MTLADQLKLRINELRKIVYLLEKHSYIDFVPIQDAILIGDLSVVRKYILEQDLESLTKPKLRSMAERLGYQCYSLSKIELINLLLDHPQTRRQ